VVIEMRWKRLALIVIVVAVVVAFAGIVGYYWYNSSQPNLAEISKQSPVVQDYLNQHSKAEYMVTKCYLAANGMVYEVDENWELGELRGSASGEPVDGRDHYCWVVHWYDPTSMIEHVVDVFIDRDVLEIVLVTEAW